jgi:predicted phosphoribosyltransferase
VIPVLPADIAERLKELVGTELSGSAEVYAAIAEIYREFRRITDSA